MKHRKLFVEDNTTGDTYQPPDCTYCFPGCPLSGTCTPIIVLDFPPPPPPPAPPPPHPSPHRHISLYLLVFIISTLGFLIFITISLIRTKIRNADRRNNDHHQSDDSDVIGDENRVVADHPIWLISTVGLQQSVINSIAVCKYKRSEGLVEGTECSVCLNEFREDETLRLLPKCNHAFHVYCIDTWLKSHTNCPLCRASIVSSSVPAPLPNQNSISSATQIENSQMGDSNQERNGVQARDIETGTEESEVEEAGNGRILKREVDSRETGSTSSIT